MKIKKINKKNNNKKKKHYKNNNNKMKNMKIVKVLQKKLKKKINQK